VVTLDIARRASGDWGEGVWVTFTLVEPYASFAASTGGGYHTYPERLSKYFHREGTCTPARVGPRGGTYPAEAEVWSTASRCKTWKTRPGEFRLTVKRGTNRGRWAYAYITQDNAHEWHHETDCPVGVVSRLVAVDYGLSRVDFAP
jgi:hypothetical protein